MKKKKLPIRRILGLVTVVVLVVCAAACWIAGSLLTAPVNRPLGEPPADLMFAAATVPSHSGSQIAIWHGSPIEPKGVLVLIHSLRGDRLSMVNRARLLRAEGYATVLIDLQGHGESPGKTITFGYLEKFDVEAAVEFARGQYPDLKIGVVGVSLGGASALLASPLNIDALVLESVFPTIEEAVHDRIAKRAGPLSRLIAPALLLQLWPRLGISPKDLRPIDAIARAGCPVLIMAGDADAHTTIAETRRLFDTAIEPKELVVFEGAEHVDLLNFDPARYKSKVLEFLNRSLHAGSGNSQKNDTRMDPSHPTGNSR